MDPIEQALADIAEERVAEIIDAMYDEYIDEMCAENELMEYAARSYDNDAQAYGEY